MKFGGPIDSNHSCFIYMYVDYRYWWVVVVVAVVAAAAGSLFLFIRNLCESSAMTCTGLTMVTYVCIHNNTNEIKKNRHEEKEEGEKIKSDRYVLIFKHPKHTHTVHLSCCRCFFFSFILFSYSFISHALPPPFFHSSVSLKPIKHLLCSIGFGRIWMSITVDRTKAKN